MLMLHDLVCLASESLFVHLNAVEHRTPASCQGSERYRFLDLLVTCFVETRYGVKKGKAVSAWYLCRNGQSD